MTKTVYVATSLTHVKTEAEKDELRAMLKWIVAEFDITLLKWAFDVDTWTPEPVDNIYDYDTERVRGADLVIVLYFSNDGSDGRGGEVVNRLEVAKKPVIVFAKEGVRVSRYPGDCFKKFGIPVQTFKDVEDMRPSIWNNLTMIDADRRASA